MIARHWRGIAHSAQGNNYIEHLRTDTFPKLASLDGFIKASILTREIEVGTEFLVITIWQSLDSIRAFAGEDAELAVVPDLVRTMMISYDQQARHYQIIDEFKL